LLVAIANRLQKCVRQGDMVARLGGDEFTILLSGIQSLEGATQIAERILQFCKKPLQLEGHTLFVDTSIGIALGASHYQTGEDLLRDADIAMYHAKMTGKARYALFDQEMHRNTLELLQLETELRQALEKKEFLLFYQPITDILTGALVGFEALLRWLHPERGFVPLATFIPVAENTGLIVSIGEWVIQEACHQVQRWQQQFPGNNLMLSINLAGQQLKEPGLVAAIDAILESTQITGHCLRLELTESMLIEDAEAIIHTLEELKARNIQLSIDDFGTGYSSLSYLHRFPVSLLKIDRSFVSRMVTESENFEIVRTICTLAHTLGMKVVAEGIETREQLTHLRNLGCEYGQGFLFSRPVEVETATKMLASWDMLCFQEQA
jgi:EAL domain-containing protein (putative c-di-GMP-specific phosphodiesterase class I)